MSSPLPQRRTHHLSFGRRSVPGATYFVTACTVDRITGLASPTVAPKILEELRAATGTDDLLIATIMPDHVHALFRLGERLTLSQTIGRVKAKSGDVLAAYDRRLAWQRKFFDHQLRDGDALESFALYIYLNPYRAGLVDLRAKWPWTYFSPSARFRFLESVDDEHAALPEWLGEVERWEKTMGAALSD